MKKFPLFIIIIFFFLFSFIPIGSTLNDLELEAPSTAIEGETIRLLILNLPDGTDSITVNWGDGLIEENITTSNPEHTYNSAGSYEIQVEAFDENNNSIASSSVWITVEESGQEGFSSLPIEATPVECEAYVDFRIEGKKLYVTPSGFDEGTEVVIYYTSPGSFSSEELGEISADASNQEISLSNFSSGEYEFFAKGKCKGYSITTSSVSLQIGSSSSGSATSTVPGVLELELPQAQAPSRESGFWEYVKTVYKWTSRIIVLLATLMIIYGGYKYMLSGGNPEVIREAKDIIIGALIGIALVALAYIFFLIMIPS